ncbi:MAG: lytic transglycosylase domain-containing protein, partial [Candidatus Binatia bacterium]
PSANNEEPLPAKIEQTPSEPEIGRIEFPTTVLRHPHVGNFIRIFSGTGRVSFRLALERSGRYRETINNIFRAQGLPDDLLYLCLIESNFFPFAVSQTKTTGLWQFTYGTGRKYGLKIDSWVDERKDPVKSTQAAASYLKDLHGQFGDWLWVVAAYNTGDEGIRRVLRQTMVMPTSPLDPKVAIKPLTRDFVAKFIASALIASEPYRYGFHNIAYDAHLNYDEVLLTESLSLKTIARRTNTTPDAIMKLNPALLRNTTPPHEKPFLLRLPVGRGGIFSGFPFALPELPRMPFFCAAKPKSKASDPQLKQQRLKMNSRAAFKTAPTRPSRFWPGCAVDPRRCRGKRPSDRQGAAEGS